jgi:hypothetical protein
VTLYDNTKSPMDFILSGGRHDFIIEHDIKELGPHTYIFIIQLLVSILERVCAKSTFNGIFSFFLLLLVVLVLCLCSSAAQHCRVCRPC